MARTVKSTSALDVCQAARRECEQTIEDLERQLAYHRNQLRDFQEIEMRLTGDPKTAMVNATAREMVYKFIKDQSGRTSLPAMLDHYYPGLPKKKRAYQATRFQKGINALIKSKSIKKHPGPNGKGHTY